VFSTLITQHWKKGHPQHTLLSLPVSQTCFIIRNIADLPGIRKFTHICLHGMYRDNSNCPFGSSRILQLIICQQKNALVFTLTYNVLFAEHPYHPLNKNSPQIIHTVQAVHTVILQLRYFLIYQIQILSHSLFESEHYETASLYDDVYGRSLRPLPPAGPPPGPPCQLPPARPRPPRPRPRAAVKLYNLHCVKGKYSVH